MVGETSYVEWRWKNDLTWSGDEVPEGGWEARNDSVLGCLLRVDEVSETGNVRITLTLDRLASSEEDPSGKVSFDSDRESRTNETSPFGHLATLVLGSQLTMEVKDYGRKIAVSGAGAIRQKIEASGLDEDAYEILKNFVDNESQRFLWERFYALYPCKEAREDTRWTTQVKSPRKLHAYEYEIEDIEQTGDTIMVHVVYSGTSRPLPEFAPERLPDGTEHTYGVARIRGSAFLDAKRGQVVTGIGTIDVDQVITSPNPDGGLPLKTKIIKTGKEYITVLTKAERRAQKAKRTGGDLGKPEPPE